MHVKPGATSALPKCLVRQVRKAANASSPQPRYGHKHYPLALAWLDAGMGTVRPRPPSSCAATSVLACLADYFLGHFSVLLCPFSCQLFYLTRSLLSLNF
eukprot:3267924-Pleurochrysis_carterae.AAC.1